MRQFNTLFWGDLSMWGLEKGMRGSLGVSSAEGLGKSEKQWGKELYYVCILLNIGKSVI